MKRQQKGLHMPPWRGMCAALLWTTIALLTMPNMNGQVIADASMIPASAEAIFCQKLQTLLAVEPLSVRGEFVGETTLGSRAYALDYAMPDLGAARLYVRPSVTEHYTLEAILAQPADETGGLQAQQAWTQRLLVCLAETHSQGDDEQYTLSVARTPLWPKRKSGGTVLNVSLERDYADRYWIKLLAEYPAP